jgi:monoamine oxidase
MPARRESCDVVIIGAGAAGLAAARVLSDAGRSTIVLEARDRLGGRIQTLRDPDFPIPIELGAEFIHGRPDATWNVIREANLIAYEVAEEHWPRRGHLLATSHDFRREMQQVMGRLKRIVGRGRRDMSFLEFLDRHCRERSLQRAREMATAFVEGFDAADPQRISAQSLAEEQEGIGDFDAPGQEQFRLLDGYGALIDALQRSINPRDVRIELNAIVREIRWRRGRVEAIVSPRDQKRGVVSITRARCAIITLPVGVLHRGDFTQGDATRQAGAVRFSPEILGVRNGAAQLASGPVVKILLRLDDDFWHEHRLPMKTPRSKRAERRPHLRDAGFLHAPREEIPTWWTARPLHVPVLTGWTGGPRAARLSLRSEADILATAIGSLSHVLSVRRRRLERAIEAARIANWPADPFARGAYSYVTVGGQRARAALARPIERALWFAGEACDTQGQASTVAGALASGERAARQVVKALA